MGIFRKRTTREVRIEVGNLEELDRVDPNSIPTLEKRLSEAGAFPIKIDISSPICVLSVENENLTTTEIMAIFQDIGFKAKIE